MSMRSTRSDLKSSRFPLKLGIHAAPLWKRRAFTQPVSGSGDRARRSEQVEADAVKLNEMAHLTSDDT